MSSLTPRVPTTPEIPHVVTQWQSGRQANRPVKASGEYLRPVTAGPTTTERWAKHSRGVKSQNSLTLLAMPESQRWDFGSIRHIRQHFSNASTPISTVETVFEVPGDRSIGSPNTSAHSSFVAELEDTSPVVLSKRSVFPSQETSPLTRGTRQLVAIDSNERGMEFKACGTSVSLSFIVFFFIKLTTSLTSYSLAL